MRGRRRARERLDLCPLRDGFPAHLAVLAHALTTLPGPRLLLALEGVRVSLPRGVDMLVATKLELVLRAVGLPVIALRAHAKLLVALTAEAESANWTFDGVEATVGLRDWATGADSCRVRWHEFEAVGARGLPPRALSSTMTSGSLDTVRPACHARAAKMK